MENDNREDLTAMYIINLDCVQCAHVIAKHLTRTQGVEKVGVDLEDGKVTVRGKVEMERIQELAEKRCKRKVEVIPLPPKKSYGHKTVERNETKQLVATTTVIKVQMHCKKCECDVKRKVSRLPGVHSVNIDSKAQTCRVDGTIEGSKLVEYFEKKMHKHAEIVKQKIVKDEKMESESEVLYNSEVHGQHHDWEPVCNWRNSIPDNFVHHAHAPQYFSDENPNACCVI